MKYFCTFLALCVCTTALFAQDFPVDSAYTGSVIIYKDNRLDVLGEKMAEYNESLASKKARTGKGYRLMVISTSDRTKAMDVRSNLIKQYPDHKVYMTFQSPFIKIKFGNFETKKEAEAFRKQILNSGIVTTNIYILPETIEIKPAPLEEETEE